jgi:hypothetical protein
MFILLEDDVRHLQRRKTFLTLNNKYDRIWNTVAAGKPR